MAANIESIINQALMLARRDRRIADIFEGSEEAIIALELYGQTRDELLDQQDWSCSRRTAPLDLLKGPPPAGGFTPATPWSNVYAAPGFLYEYAYPTDCLDLRAILQQPGAMPDTDPVPTSWRVDNDAAPNVSGDPPVASGPPARVIYCNTTNALAVYRAQITDPTQYDNGLTAAIIESLAEKFIKAFGEPVGAQQEQQNTAMSEAAIASSLRG